MRAYALSMKMIFPPRIGDALGSNGARVVMGTIVVGTQNFASLHDDLFKKKEGSIILLEQFPFYIETHRQYSAPVLLSHRLLVH